jgi:L-glutamine-phosphate cytidylyltransferase
MKAIILSAGQGSRLLPHTEATPKCLLSLGGETILGHQVRELAAAGVRRIVVVTGFRAVAVEAELERLRRSGLSLSSVFNPFYGVADNLGSCWMARAEMECEFVLVNGDTLFERAIPDRLLATAAAYPVTLTIDRKESYDSDDMKVALDGHRLVEVGKRLDSDRVDGESIGMSLYRGRGPRLFTEVLDSFMRTGAGIRSWYLKAVDALAQRGAVGTVSIDGLRWGEVDFPHDLARARRLFGRQPGNLEMGSSPAAPI